MHPKSNQPCPSITIVKAFKFEPLKDISRLKLPQIFYQTSQRLHLVDLTKDDYTIKIF